MKLALIAVGASILMLLLGLPLAIALAPIYVPILMGVSAAIVVLIAIRKIDRDIRSRR
mgnify:FL=1